MDKVQKAQELADKLLDECICQVGDNKGALPDVPESLEDSMDDLEDYTSMGEEDGMLDESKEVKVSDVPKDKQKIFKINRGKARKKGGKLTKAEKGGKPIKESDLIKTAQQKDTLFDNLNRIMKDKTGEETCLNPEPTTEGWLSNLASKVAKKSAEKSKKEKTGWFASLQKKGLKVMKQKQNEGIPLTKKKNDALKAATQD